MAGLADRDGWWFGANYQQPSINRVVVKSRIVIIVIIVRYDVACTVLTDKPLKLSRLPSPEKTMRYIE